MKDKKGFGSFIKEKRISKNYSQKDLAELLYVTESAVSKWERGVTYPDITLISNICKVLDVSEKELIQSSDDEEYRRMKKDSDKYNKIKKTLFWTFNICYMVAILTCFIVNLAVDHTLSWFFIVLASIIVAYTFCPTITWVYEKYKLPIFITSTFIGLFLLLLTCSIYTNDYWFMIPTMGILLGYFIVFYPILFSKQKHFLSEENYKKSRKYFLLTYSVGCLLLICLLLISIHCYNPFSLWVGLIISGGCLLLPIIFGIIKIFDSKNVVIKIVSISLAGVLSLLIIVGFGIAIHEKLTKETQVYTTQETYKSIDIDVKTYDINIHLSTTKENKIEYTSSEKMYVETKVINEVLVIEEIDNRKGYEKMFQLGSDHIDLYLSESILDNVTISGSTGNINIGKGFTFTNLEVDFSTGNIQVLSSVTNTLSISNSTGDIKIKDCGNIGDVAINTSTGDIELINFTCQGLNINCGTGNTDLINVVAQKDCKIDGSTGNITLDGFDAANIYIEISAGDVKGTILSNKFFDAKSSTGDVNVPSTREGGECVIYTSTGDIKISYKQ